MYIYQPTEFNGNSLVDGNFKAVWFDATNGPMVTRQFDPVEAAVIGLGDRDVRAQPKGSYWELHCTLREATQSDRDTFLTIFNEEVGLVTLKARDNESPVARTWNVSCRVVGTRRVGRAWGYFVVVLRVPDATWQEDISTTDAQTAMVGSSRAFSITNGGNRKTRPQFTITPRTTKTNPFDDQLMTARGLILPPASSHPITDYPVDLLNNPANVVIDHNALVRGTQRADLDGALAVGVANIPYDTGVNGNPDTLGLAIIEEWVGGVNEVGGVDETQTTITYDVDVSWGGPPPVAGLIRIEEELIRYTGGGGGASGTLIGCTRGYANTVPSTHAENVALWLTEQISYTGGGGGASGTLTGVMRGVGGTLDQVHVDNTYVHASKVLLNGDDVQLAINGLAVTRYVAGCFSSTDFRVWAVVTMQAHSRKTISLDIAANDTTIVLNEGVADLPDKGFLAIYDHVTRVHEVVYYGGRALWSRAITGVVRGLWNTTAVSHAASTPVNLVPSEAEDDSTLPGDFERDEEGWTGKDTATVARTTTQRRYGDASFETATGVGIGAGVVSPIIPAAESIEYTVSVWVRREEGVVDIKFYMQDQSNNPIATSPVLSTVVGDWFRVELTGTTGVGDTGIILWVAKDNDATDITFQIDGVQVEIGNAATPFGTMESHVDSPIALYEISAGNAAAKVPYAPDAKRPAIGLHLSENDDWRWGGYGTKTLDKKSIFYSVWHPDRPALFKPFGLPDEGDVADKLRLELSGDELTWVDKDKKAGKALLSSLVLPLPAGANNVFTDLQERSDIRLRVLGVDAGGDIEEIIDERDLAEATAAVDVVPDDPLYALWLQGVRAAVTGNDEEDLETTIATPRDVYLRIVIAQTTKVTGVQLRLRKSDAVVSMDFKVGLYESHGVYPNRNQAIIEYDQATGSTSGALTAPGANGFDGDELDDAALETVEFTSSGGVVELIAGIYWLKLETTVASASNAMVVSRGPAKTFNNIMYSPELGFVREKPAWVRILHANGGPIQLESALLNADESETGRDASFLGVRTTFEFPVVAEREDVLAEDKYHCTGIILNTTNGEQIEVDWWMAANEQLVIDCEARTATYINGNGDQINALAAITLSNLIDWVSLDPGVNDMQYNESGMVDTDLDTVFQGRKV